MSLRERAIEQEIRLPDDRRARLRVGLARDSYIQPSELDTVTLELFVEDELAAVLETVLDADQDSGARELVREAAAGLEQGSLEPTAGSLEPLAETLR